jgi:hypothetical protein
MGNRIPAVGRWPLAIAGLTALALASAPVRAQDTPSSDRLQAQRTVEVETEVEAETEVQRLETTQVQTLEVERREVQVEQVNVQSSSQVAFTETVQVAVFEAITQSVNVNAANLQIVEVSRRSWSDGCLGLALADTMCTQAITPGYLVTVTDGEDIWVYRTNTTGTVVYLDTQATEMQVTQTRLRGTQINFSDVPSDYWAARHIRELAVLDILAGYPDGRYRPNAAVTRAEFAAIVRRAFNVPKVRGTVKFVDVDDDYWAVTAIDEAYTMGFLSGVDSREFRPLAQLFRGDVMLAIARGLNISVDDDALELLDDYSDATISSTEARLLIAALASEGIIVNYPNVQELALDRVATRAEVAVLVYQALYSMGYVARIDSPYGVRDTRLVTDITAETINTSSDNYSLDSDDWDDDDDDDDDDWDDDDDDDDDDDWDDDDDDDDWDDDDDDDDWDDDDDDDDD